MLALVAALLGALVSPCRVGAADADVEVFTRAGCLHCGDAARFLDDLRQEMPELRVVFRDVGADPEALARLRALAAAHGRTALGVPAFAVGDALLVGFGGPESTGQEIRRLLAARAGAAPPVVDVPLLGPVTVDDVGLPVFTLALGLLDGFNPCAMWLLAFVLSLLVNLHDRRRMLAVGGTFVLVSGLVYFAFMAAWLNVFFLLGHSRLIESLLGCVALGIGVLNVKDFVALGQGPSLSIPAAAKPGLYARVRRIVYAERLGPALVGAAALATLVNLVELLCTAGLPALYTHVLARQALPPWRHYAYLGLYNAAYMLDDALLLAVTIVTLERLKLAETGGRRLKLVNGLVMLGLGALLLAE